MNVAQIIRRALFDADAVQLDLTTHRFFTQVELLAWANDGRDMIEKALEQAGEDYNLLFLKSTDSAFRWDGETYTPSGFKPTSGTRTYTLPPHVKKLRSIRPSTAGATRFEHLDITHPYFRDLENRTDITNPMYWDVVGDRTLVIANPQTIDVELAFIARSRKMFMYTTGTWTSTQNSAAVTGGSTTWVISELYTPCEVIGMTDTNTPKVVSQTSGGNWVDPSAIYSPVSVITTDTALTLLGNWLPASVAAKNYMLASVPNIPVEYQWILVDYICAKCLYKGSHPKAGEKMAGVEKALTGISSQKVSEREASSPRVTIAFPDQQPGMSWAGTAPGGMRGAPDAQ